MLVASYVLSILGIFLSSVISHYHLRFPRSFALTTHRPLLRHHMPELFSSNPMVFQQSTKERELKVDSKMDDYFNSLYRQKNSSGIIDEYFKIVESGLISDMDLYLDHHASFNLIFSSLLYSRDNELNSHAKKLYSKILSTPNVASTQQMTSIAEGRLDSPNYSRNSSLSPPDTLNIYLSYLFRRRSISDTKELFQSSFFANHSRYRLNRRSLNIMMDGFREFGDLSEMNSYFSLFDKYNITPDAYTFTVLIRAAQTRQELLSLVRSAVSKEATSTPFFRCVIESLGKIGYPAEAFLIALKYLNGPDSIFQSSRSADALLAALLQDPMKLIDIETNSITNAVVKITSDSLLELDNDGTSNNLSTSRSLLAIEFASQLLLPTPNCTIALLLNRGNCFKTEPVACGGKGFCMLFNAISKHIRIENDQQLGSIRDDLLHVVTGQLLQQPPAFVFDGRLCDAIIRSYKYQVKLATEVWREKLLPCIAHAERQQGASSDDTSSFRRNCAENGLEALMFVYGFNDRPDLALEVGYTVRKYDWGRSVRQLLAKSYGTGLAVQSKLSQNFPMKKKSMFPFMSGVLKSNYENSLEAELGVELGSLRNISSLNAKYSESIFPVQKIRIKIR